MTLALAGLLTIPEIQRLFAKRLLKPTVSATFVRLWSRWRREHQAKAAKSRVRQETVKDVVVEVLYDEGLATHIDPEPCAGIREDVGEASVGDDIGQPLNREIGIVSDADALWPAEGNTDGRVIASARTVRRGRRPWHVSTLLVRELGGLTVGREGAYAFLVRIGKVRSRSR